MNNITLNLKCILTHMTNNGLIYKAVYNSSTYHKYTYSIKNVRNYTKRKEHQINPDTFGNLVNMKHLKMDMDEEESKEEEFEENSARIPAKMKPRMSEYINKIREHVSRKDITSALDVLQTMNKNRDRANNHIYNLLIRACGIQGDLRRSFHLYNDMKKRNIKPTEATYNSLINSCAECSNTELALSKLNSLRSHLYDIHYILNETHYNTMIKAYSKHNKFYEAFQLIDEMKDKAIAISEATFANLLFSATTDKKAGVRHGVIIWQMMRYHHIRPTLTTWNLLLRAIRDTSIGDLHFNDILIEPLNIKICQIEEGTPDLLSNPPILNSMCLHNEVENMPKTYDPKENNIALKEMFEKNRLLLFGGFEKILQHMDNDKVKPDVKTFTILIETLPNSVKLEKKLLETAHERNVEFDIDIFNTVIKKRSLKFDYGGGKEILNWIQKHNLRPNIMTFGLLAWGCQNQEQGDELIQGINDLGYQVNTVIIGTLITNACFRRELIWLIDLIHYMIQYRIRPNRHLYQVLDNFQEKTLESIKKKTRCAKNQRLFKENFDKFMRQYEKLQMQAKRASAVATLSNYDHED